MANDDTHDALALVPKKTDALAAPEEELRGRIDAVRYSQGGFTVGKVRAADGVVHTFCGKCVVMAGDPVILHGSWGTHARFGLQFEVRRAEFDGDLSEEGLANFLAGHPEARGIGPKKALAIAGHFQGRFDETLEHDPAEIAKVAGVKLAVVEKLRTVWMKGRDEIRCRLFLASLDLTPETSDAILRAYTRMGLSGMSIKNLLESDPFALSRDVRGFGFQRADQVARKVGLDPTHPTRIAAGIEHAVSKQLDDGHTWTAYPDLVTAANNLLAIDREKVDAIVDAMPGPHADARQMTDGLKKAVEDERVLRMLDGFRRNPRLVGRRTDTYGTMGLARPDVYEKELAIGRRFYELGRSPYFGEADAERIARESEGEGLNLGQRRALWTGLRFNMCVVTGAAGTGKSFFAGKLADAYEKAGAKVTFAAPTGKAAKRMESLSGRKAVTLHRLLGYQGHRFTRETEWFDGDKIAPGLVVVDEASMIDVLLFQEMLDCIDPTRTVLVLLGDHHQLPPVGPGNVLRDVTERKPIPVVVLDEVVRQAGVLKEASVALLKGEVRPSVWEKTEDGKLFAPWYVADRFVKAIDAGKYCLELAGLVLPQKLGFDPVEVQFLSPMYKGPAGVDAINIGLQRLYQDKLYGVKVRPLEEGQRPALYENDRVAQTKNNYDLGAGGIMNGSQGFVRRVIGDGTFDVEFEGEMVRVPRAAARDLTLAYCLTTHRSQGSEWPAAICLTHSAHSHMLSRNLLYTAVTRASKTAIVVGDSKGIRGAAARSEASKRRTWLSVLELPKC